MPLSVFLFICLFIQPTILLCILSNVIVSVRVKIQTQVCLCSQAHIIPVVTHVFYAEPHCVKDGRNDRNHLVEWFSNVQSQSPIGKLSMRLEQGCPCQSRYGASKVAFPLLGPPPFLFLGLWVTQCVKIINLAHFAQFSTEAQGVIWFTKEHMTF